MPIDISKAQQAIIANDYGMVKKQFTIKTRGCLVLYALRLLQLDASKIETKPEAQQIVIANLDELKPWLF